MSRQVIVATLVLVAATQLSAQERPKSERTPIATLAGSKSKIVKQKVVRILSNDEWKALWREHKTGSAKSTQDWDDSETLRRIQGAVRRGRPHATDERADRGGRIAHAGVVHGEEQRQTISTLPAADEREVLELHRERPARQARAR